MFTWHRFSKKKEGLTVKRVKEMMMMEVIDQDSVKNTLKLER